MSEPEFSVRPLSDSDCKKQPSKLTLDDLFTHEHGYYLRPHDIARISGGVYSSASVIEDCRKGHLSARLIGGEDEVRYYVIAFDDAREYMRPFRRESPAAVCWPGGDIPSRAVQPPIQMGRKPRSFVYFIQSGDYIKIGISVWIPRRMRALRHANPHQLELIHSIESSKRMESREIERALHKKFAAYRYCGEWFRDCPEIRAYIAESKAEQEEAA